MKRSKSGNTKLNKNIQYSRYSRWAEAIADAEAKLVIAKQRVHDLRIALSILKEQAAKATPFPGEDSKS